MTTYEMNNMTLKDFIGYAKPYTQVRVLHDEKPYETVKSDICMSAYEWYNEPLSKQLEVIRFDTKYDFSRNTSVMVIWVRFI